MDVKIIYKGGNEYTIKGVKEYCINLRENVMYYILDEVYFIANMPLHTWPLDNVAEVKQAERQEVKA